MSWLTQRMQAGAPGKNPFASVPAGGMKLLTVNDATPIDPQAKSGGNTVGASGSGWVATIVLKGITSLVGTCVPSALTLSVSDPGYDTSGNATTVSRTITGVAMVRRQYPNGNTKMISTDGTDLTVLISLDDWIYTGTTIVSATIGGTFYTGCTAGSTGTVIQNLSATGYTKPLFGWLNEQEDALTSGTTLAVEGVAFHRHAKAGQQVACVKYSATDGSTTGTTALVSATTLSTKLVQGNLPEVWAASVDFSGLALTTGSTYCTVNAKVYPWLGDSTGVLDLINDGVAWPTVVPITPLRVLNDRTLAYGGAFAYVQVGAAGTPQVSKTAATARANPYSTVVAAMNAIKTFNNANGIAHNDHGGAIVRLMDNAGAAQTHTFATAPTAPAAASATYCTIEPDPLNTGAISLSWSAQTQYPDMMRWRGMTILGNATTSRNIIGRNSTRGKVVLDKMTYDATAAVMDGAVWYSMKYLRNITLTGGRTIDFNGFPDTGSGIALMAGFVGTATSTVNSITTQGRLSIGNQLPKHTVQIENVSPVSADPDDGRILYNNKFYKAIYQQLTVPRTLTYGLANVQNLFEHDGADAAVMSMNMLADGDLTSLRNYVEQHNTAVGNRCSRMYNDVAADQVVPNGLIKMGSSLYNIWDDYNCKTDTFNQDNVGAPGNWSYIYSVGNRGNVSLFGAVNRSTADAPANDNTANYLGCAWLPSSEYNLTRPGIGLTQAQVMALFGSYTVGPAASPAIGGNYVPTSAATYLKSRVPAGASTLKYDIAGTLRRTDGTGAAGAYESL